MRDYAIVLSCTPGYGFGMIASMNAQNHFKTNADWEIAYEGYTEEERAAISGAFPFAVNWTPVSELMLEVNDRRSNREEGLNRMWLSYWLLAHRLLREKKYKAVCVIQADTFVFVNLDNYFKIAEAGILACSEFAFTYVNAEDLPFGNERGVWDRSSAGVFDAINFIGQQYTDLVKDIIEFQCEDAFSGESNHSVIALNRAVCKHGTHDKILGLDRNLWSCDSIWGDGRLVRIGDRIFNASMVQLCSWHCRWWQIGRVTGEWMNNRESIVKRKNDPEYRDQIRRLEHNYSLVRDYMADFNRMIPAIESKEYFKEPIVCPTFSDGAQC